MNELLHQASVEQAGLGLLGWAERGWLPDAAIRVGIRRLCAQRLNEERAGGVDAQQQRMQRRLAQLRTSPLALHADAANRQHYEVPTAFFQQCLGARMKYSCAYYPSGRESLDQAEEAMLELTAERALLADGQDVLELGCGWGSLTLWMAKRYPASRITAVSNSASQRSWIEQRCEALGLRNVRVLTSDINVLQLPDGAFDRCVSVEMFEHVRNHAALMQRIAGWLRPGGKLFVHVFCHRTLLYPFEVDGEDDWMGRHFFTGGLMPAADMLLHFQQHLAIDERWLLDGRHYARTAEHWLARHNQHASAATDALRSVYGDAAPLWNQRWRMFWMACAELFGYAEGQEWMVAHYLFNRPEATR